MDSPYLTNPAAPSPADPPEAAAVFCFPEGDGQGLAPELEEADGIMSPDCEVLALVPSGAGVLGPSEGVAWPAAGDVLLLPVGVGVGGGGLGDTDGVVLALPDAGGDPLPDTLGDGEALPVFEIFAGVHEVDREGTGTPPTAPGKPDELDECGSGVPAPATPDLPEPPPDPELWVNPKTVKPESPEEMTCGSVMMAKAPAATTKMAVPIAAIGRSQAIRRLP